MDKKVDIKNGENECIGKSEKGGGSGKNPCNRLYPRLDSTRFIKTQLLPIVIRLPCSTLFRPLVNSLQGVSNYQLEKPIEIVNPIVTSSPVPVFHFQLFLVYSERIVYLDILEVGEKNF